MNIGFDLDRVFINTPPLIPSVVITKLYGEKSDGDLSYRMPGRIEQYIRKLSHASFLRPPIEENIVLLKKNVGKKKNLFLISSRFGFLENETKYVIQKNHLDTYFAKLFFNFDNKQPHLFKESVIIAHNISQYVDDDLPLLKFLGSHFPDRKFFWFNKDTNRKISKNIQAVTHLDSIFHSL